MQQINRPQQESDQSLDLFSDETELPNDENIQGTDIRSN
jgi:hypothetical protein